jgi:hypothetical protein
LAPGVPAAAEEHEEEGVGGRQGPAAGHAALRSPGHIHHEVIGNNQSLLIGAFTLHICRERHATRDRIASNFVARHGATRTTLFV